MDVYEKSYKELVLFLSGMLVALLGLGIAFAIWKPEHGARLTINLCTLFVALLMFVIWRTEKIYWINGVDFERAKEAGSERRKAFALRYLKRFAWFSLFGMLVSVSFALLGLHQMIDFSLISVGIVVIAFSTVSIKL